MTVRIKAFGGMIPAVADELLPEAAAALAKNTWLYPGLLAGMNKPKLIRTLSSDTVDKVYRIPNNYTDASALLDAAWLELEDIDTDVVRSAVAGDIHDRYYWAAPSHSPKYNTRERIAAGNPPWNLGVPTPGAISVSANGGSSELTESRAYVVTWVSAYGEEGAPSAPFLLTGRPDDTWTVVLPTPDPNHLGEAGHTRNLTKARIYRTVTSSGNLATYFFVAEVDIEDADYDDDNLDTVVTANEQLASFGWTPPPSGMAGIVSLPNGINAGWVGNEIWFSEPYRPHAWPAEYSLSVEYPVVGMGVVNQMIVICTQGVPMTATGIHPSVMTLSKLSANEPCLSRGSIVSTPEGVFYASHNGLMLVAQGVATNVTRKLITKDRWSQLVRAETMRAARLGTGYYAFGSVRFGVFSEAFYEEAFAQEDFLGAYNGVLIEPTDERVAFTVLFDADPLVNLMNDPWSGELLLIRDDKLYWLDVGDQDPEMERYVWRSKIFQTLHSKNYAVARIYFDVPPTAPELNPVPNPALEQELAEDQYGLVRLYADKKLVWTREIRKTGEVMKLPSGYKADFWQIEIEARVKITSFEMGHSEAELRRV